MLILEEIIAMIHRIFKMNMLQVKHCLCQFICKYLFLHLKII